ncbi:MAG: class II aldolase, partial [Pseudomonadota bacterium]
GPGIALPAAGHSDAEAVAAAARAGRKLVLFPGRGAAVPQDASASVRALAGCLVDVAARLPEAPELLRLDAEEEAGLLNWDAEKYRQALDGARP